MIALALALLLHDVAPIFGYDRIERGIDLSAEVLYGASTIRANAGLTLNTFGHTSSIYAGALAHGSYRSIFFELGLGLAANVNAVRALGSSVLFRISAAIGYTHLKHSLSIVFTHLSNAKAIFRWDRPNAGLDRLGIQYRYSL